MGLDMCSSASGAAANAERRPRTRFTIVSELASVKNSSPDVAPDNSASSSTPLERSQWLYNPGTTGEKPASCNNC